MVITQACSVVSPVLEKDPHVELAVVTRHNGKFSPRSFEATGRNVRTFCVCLTDGDAKVPYNIDINGRFTVPREKLLDLAPDGPLCSDEDSYRIANWVARYYNRTALPSLMVNRLAAASFQKRIHALLEFQFEGAPLHEQVVSVYGQWEPDDEIGPYRFHLDVIARGVDGQEFLLRLLSETYGLTFGEPVEIGIDDVTVTVDVLVHDQVTLADLDEKKRISEWDLLSGLMEQT
jgi:hypothetical protein